MQKLNSMKPGFRKLKKPTRWFVGFFGRECYTLWNKYGNIYATLFVKKTAQMEN